LVYYESSYFGIVPLDGDNIQHVGVKGTHWGVRRYQNEDGSLTPLGREHYGYGKRKDKKLAKYKTKELKKLDKRYDKKIEKLDKKTDKIAKKYEKTAKKYDSGPDLISAKKHLAQEKKLNKIADKYQKASEKKHEREASKSAEKSRVENSTYKQMKRDRRRVLLKSAVGYTGGGLIWAAARQGKYKEKTRISRKTRADIRSSSKNKAVYERMELERRKIKRR